jgi:RNA polymerase sigma factor (sigma-70 family)
MAEPANPAVHEANSKEARPTNDGRALLEENLALIERRLHVLSRRGGLPANEADDFRSWALCKLIEDDYRILADWEGLSSFSTYLAVVLVHLLQDYRTHLWGKWRPSSAARRHGAASILLERLLMRDRLSLDEAIRRMREEHGVMLSSAALEEVAARLPQRLPRRLVGDEVLQGMPAESRVEVRIVAGERAEVASRLNQAVSALLRRLAPDERDLLKLHYVDDLSIAAISRMLGRPQRALYTLRNRCLKVLRRGLEAAGLCADQVRDLLAD